MRPSLSILLLPLALWAKTPLLAVNDFGARGVAKNDAAILSDRLRAALVQTGKVRVLERSEMDKILAEQAFQKSGACDQSECAVEIGKLLAVDRMVVGTVGKIGNLYTLSARILDVGTGEVLFSATQDSRGVLEDLLMKAVPEMGARLAEGALGTTGGAVTVEGYGDLEITLDDPAARLTMDGRVIGGQSPFLLEHIEAGSHRLEAHTATRRVEATIELQKDDLLKIVLQLELGTAVAKLFSEPTGAEVFLDGRDLAYFGQTPLKLDSVQVGNHTVTFRKPGYLDTTLPLVAVMGNLSTTRVRLAPGGNLVLVPAPAIPVRLIHGRDTLETSGAQRIALPVGDWQFELSHPLWVPVSKLVEIRQGVDDTVWLTKHFATLVVSCSSPADVWMDGVNVGSTPLHLYEVEPGTHAVELRAVGMTNWHQSVRLESGESQAVYARLESRFAWLHVASKVKARVELDGKAVGSLARDSAAGPLADSGGEAVAVSVVPDEWLWSSDTLVPGPHHLRLVADRRVPWEVDVNLAPGATVDFDANLPWTPDELAHRRREFRLNRRIALGAVTAISTAVATYFWWRWQDNVTQARQIQANYDASRSDFPTLRARYEQARSDANGARTVSFVTGGLAALAAAGLGLTWAF